MKHVLNLLTASRLQLLQSSQSATSVMINTHLSPRFDPNISAMPSFFQMTSLRRYSSDSVVSPISQEVESSSKFPVPFEQRKAILFHQTWLQIQYCFRHSGHESSRKTILDRVRYLDDLRKDLIRSQNQADFIDAFNRYKPAYQKGYGLHPKMVALFDAILDHFIFDKRSIDIFRAIIADYQSRPFTDIETKVDADFHQIKSMLSAIIQEFTDNPIWVDTAPRPKFCRAITEAESETDIAVALYTIPSSYYFPEWTQTRFHLVNGSHLYQQNKMKFFLELLAYGESAIRDVNKEVIDNHYRESWGSRWESLYRYNEGLIFPMAYYGNSNRVMASFEDMTFEHRKAAIFLALYDDAQDMLSVNDQAAYLKLIPIFYALYNAKEERDLETIHSELSNFKNVYLNRRAIDFYLLGKSNFRSMGEIIHCERRIEGIENHSVTDLYMGMTDQFQRIKYGLGCLLYFRINLSEWKEIAPPLSDEILDQIIATKHEGELIEKLQRFNLLAIPWAQARKLLTTIFPKPLTELDSMTVYESAIVEPSMQRHHYICRILQVVPDFVLPDDIKDTLTLKYGYVIARDLAHDDERCSQSRWWREQIGSFSYDHVRAYVVKKLKEWVLNGEFIEQVTPEIAEFEDARNNAQVFAEWEKYTLPWVPEKEFIDASASSTYSPRLFTPDERERRIQQAEEIDIPVLEDSDKQLATLQNQR